MVRSFFLAIGLCLMIVGVECLGVERAVLTLREPAPPTTTLFEDSAAAGANRVIAPSESLPWCLLGGGAIVCIYSFTLPSRVKG